MYMTDRWILLDGKYSSKVVCWRNDLLLVALKICGYGLSLSWTFFFSIDPWACNCLPYLPDVRLMLWRQ